MCFTEGTSSATARQPVSDGVDSQVGSWDDHIPATIVDAPSLDPKSKEMDITREILNSIRQQYLELLYLSKVSMLLPSSLT